MCRGRGPDIPARHRLGQSPEGPAPAGQARLCWQGNRRAWKVTGQVHTNRGLTLRRRPVVPGAGRRQTGRSDMGVPLRVLVTDHPPAHGEHFLDEARDLIATGSSPRARGAHVDQPGQPGARGIIPACAGSTTGCASPTFGTRDHPRVRGEHVRHVEEQRNRAGSSPRARGARLQCCPRAVPPGIIPACAGSTLGHPVGQAAHRDHPRVRGEHASWARSVPKTLGSSPRARGALEIPFHVSPFDGIIPACAGSTTAYPMKVDRPGDHPRVRGEHQTDTQAILEGQGSSPRARGARRRGCSRPGGGGIIPACAGSTTARPAHSPAGGDHPRVRGEHNVAGCPRTSHPGSSPRARGALLGRAEAAHEHGIIPACAGSTWRFLI